MAAVKEEPKLDFDLDFDAPAPQGTRKKLGEMLVAAEKLTSADVKRTLSLQQEATGMRFGDAAQQLGLASSEDVQQALSKQFKYEFLSGGHGTVAREISIAYDPQCAGAEAVRRLRSNLVLNMAKDARCEAIAVVSPSNGDGRSFVAANLAIAFAQMRRRTLLIDADMRRPCQHLNFGLKNQVGFATILAERGANDCMSRIEGFNELSVVTSGPTPPNPQELLGRPVLTRFIEVVRSHFDVVIFDTPACTESADAALLANLATSAVLVVRRHHTALRDVQRATADMATAQAKVLGVVLNSY